MQKSITFRYLKTLPKTLLLGGLFGGPPPHKTGRWDPLLLLPDFGGHFGGLKWSKNIDF